MINNLGAARLEFRSEEDPDVARYTHGKLIEVRPRTTNDSTVKARLHACLAKIVFRASAVQLVLDRAVCQTGRSRSCPQATPGGQRRIHRRASVSLLSHAFPQLPQVLTVEPTQELDQCRRCLVAAIDALLARMRAARVR